MLPKPSMILQFIYKEQVLDIAFAFLVIRVTGYYPNLFL